MFSTIPVGKSAGVKMSLDYVWFLEERLGSGHSGWVVTGRHRVGLAWSGVCMCLRGGRRGWVGGGGWGGGLLPSLSCGFSVA